MVSRSVSRSVTRTVSRPVSGIVAAFFPTDIADLELWLDADDATTISDTSGEVDTWTDKSTNGFTATASGTARPETGTDTINSKNTLTFDGSATIMNLGQPAALDFTPSTDPFTIFVVSEAATSVTGAIFAKAGSTSAQRQYYLFHDLNENVNKMATVTGGTNNKANITSTGSPKMFTYVTSTTDTELFVDGVSGGTGSIGTATNIADVTIGARRGTDVNTGSGFHFTGKVAEILVYSRELSMTEIQDVEEYLDNKWGIL